MTTHDTTTRVTRAREVRPLVRRAGIAAAALFAGFAGLQVALAAGAPFGTHVWGGAGDAVLSCGLRVASGGAAVVLTWMASVVLARSGTVTVSPVPRHRLRQATWGIAAFMALNTLGNLASQSSVEQLVMAPATALTVVVARCGERE